MEAGYIPASNASSGGPASSQAALTAAAATKVIRAPGLKRGKFEEAITDRIKLENVFGLTVSSNAALDCDPNAELVAYPAGCTVVLYNTRKNRQSHIVSSSRKTITCVAFSSDGRYLATGECGHAPCVRVWDLQDPTSGGSGGVQLGEFSGHKYGVNCVAFSISSKYLVSIGSQHDMIVNVWDWKANLKLASNKVSSKVKAVSFAENGSYFVTVGNRHVKFWYLEYSRSAKYKEPVPLMGRSAILGEQRNNDFCDVACGRGDAADTTYAITKSGLLCEFNNRRLLKQWVELRTTSANCMSVGNQFIFIGCADGLVRCFSPMTLMYVTTLPRPHYLGVDVSLGMNITHMFNVPPNAKYPDAIALTYDEQNHKLSCVYNDHSFYVWDVRDIMRIGKSNSALYHSACIWGVEMLPTMETVQNSNLPMPMGSFLTCSSDDTVRVWNLNQSMVQSGDNDTIYKGNIYSNELLKVIYVDPDNMYLKDVDLTATNDKEKPVSYDGKNGVRCIRMSPCGQHIAHGDRAGNVRVSCAKTARPIVLLEAHDAEVLCLEYSPLAANGPRLLASASRDRLIHLFNVDEGYKFMQTLDDHSSSITSVRFLITNSTLQMVSCGADKTILFRELVILTDGSASFSRAHVVSGKSTLYDMEVEGTPSSARSVLAACQDRCVRVYSAQHAKHTKTFRASTADDGSLIKVALDTSGIYVATSCTDKTLCVYDYYSGECMATMYGHSELVTGLRFSLDCQYLISASGDGCVFVWRVPHDMVVTMRARLAQQAIRQGRKPLIATGIAGVDSEDGDVPMGSPPRRHGNIGFEDEMAKQNAALVEMPDYRLSIGRLPSWAQKSLDVLPLSGNDSAISTSTNPASTSDEMPIVPPRGKWAKRMQNPAVDSGNYPGLERRLDSDGSKDSSLDSGTDTRLYADRLRESSSQISVKQTLIRSVKMSGIIDTRLRHHTDDSSLGSFKFEDLESTEHDGDVEDISDGERTSSSDHNNRTTYYPGNNEESTPSEFTVNAMDVEELRQSQRRLKKTKVGLGTGGDGNLSPVPKGRPLMNLPIISVSGTSVSGSGVDSEEDDDEVSTPSGDNADKNPLSGSCESIDTLGMRGKFLKSAFESLSGAEMNAGHGHTSISAQHHLTLNVRSNSTSSKQLTPAIFKVPSRDNAPIAAPRNSSLISTTKNRDDGTTRTREELNRRIEETRRQLESVGYRSGLKSSQSTMDLSYLPEKDHNSRLNTSSRQRPVSMAIQNNNRMYGPGSGKVSMSPGKSSNLPSARQQQRHGSKFGSSMTRSSSVGVLNQSDSESDPSMVVRPSSVQPSKSGSGLMRPTISSQNKVAPGAARRRGLQSAYSSVNLSTVGQEDSSSEAESTVGNNGAAASGKPAIPPRPRAVSIDHSAHNTGRRGPGGRSGSERDLSAKAREVTMRLTSSAGGRNDLSRNRTADGGRNDNQLSQQLCQQLAEQLTRTASKVVQLYRKLSNHPGEGTFTAPADSSVMLTGLEQAIAETQKMLRSATNSQLSINQQKSHPANGSINNDEPISLSSTSGTDGETADSGRLGLNRNIAIGNAADKLEELVSKGMPNTNGDAMLMIDQYSDILLNMMQRNMMSGSAQQNQNGSDER